ncbi:ATP synthase d subunit [Geranomyces variabilis]|uniref:ATP synthase subunit d, mitochondrial n=1 Tax=Geranomyces variabilis TaxID=109894 RepID=A0AAD5XTV0_9FUNG|nr:ATP synthase d subunit [Geranomyces variabilis]
MAAPARQAARIDWSALGTKLKPETVAAVNAFRRRHTELTKTVADLREQSATIDFAHYQKVLKNKAVVNDAEKAFKAFKPATYDLSEQIRAIEGQQQKAVAAAQKTAKKVNVEVDELKVLLKNIETARPVDQLTVEDVAKAYPELDKTVEKMAKRGQWKVPGYYERFGDFIVGF